MFPTGSGREIVTNAQCVHVENVFCGYFSISYKRMQSLPTVFINRKDHRAIKTKTKTNSNKFRD